MNILVLYAALALAFAAFGARLLAWRYHVRRIRRRRERRGGYLPIFDQQWASDPPPSDLGSDIVGRPKR